MNELYRTRVKTELYEFAEAKLDQYGESGMDLTVISLLEVTTEIGINVYGIDETLNLIRDVHSSLTEMKNRTAN